MKKIGKYFPQDIEPKWPHKNFTLRRRTSSSRSQGAILRGRQDIGRYFPDKIEKRWQIKWKESGLHQFESSKKTSKGKYYNLVELAYPSGDLHLGHWFAFVPPDAHARYMKMKGYNVFFPNGFDAFGLPAENAAIKKGIHPKDWTLKNIETMRLQFETMGTMIDWNHTATTCEPDYYRWNQWIFLKMFEKGIAYRGKALSNWCPTDQTVLANEHIENGCCWRCGTEVIQKEVEQWFLKITDYADKLLWENTSEKVSNGVEWPKSVREGQNNWIGRSEGVEFDLQVKNSKEKITVYTTRIDTVFGMTYVVLAPEHQFVQKLLDKNFQFLLRPRTQDRGAISPSLAKRSGAGNFKLKDIKKYVEKAKRKTELERKEDRIKSGIFSGEYAINPFNGKEVPIWISDYVLAGYGTGAIMSVPGHDERDCEFAKKFGLPIKEVIIPVVIDKHDPPRTGVKTVFRKAVQVILINPKNNKVLVLRWKKFPRTTFITGGVEEGEGIVEAAKREIREETGFVDFEYVKTLGGPVESHFYANHKNENRKALFTGLVFKLKSEKQNNISKEEESIHEPAWMSWEELDNDKNVKCSEYEIWLDRLSERPSLFTDYGVLVNSDEYDGLNSQEAKNKLADLVEKEKIGIRKVNYHLRDWSISRQRYWGTPIPIIYCVNCWKIKNHPFGKLRTRKSKIKMEYGRDYIEIDGQEYAMVKVPETDLPVELPYNVDFTPKGKPPLATDEKWLNIKCPNCNGEAKRDAETLDTFFDSAWYFYRYVSPDYKDGPFDKTKVKELMPVDIYFGGSEHTLGHTLYARFFTKFFKDLGLVSFDEFANKRLQHGIVLGSDGNKMSKSRGNVVSPDDVVKEFGADTVRLYLCFMMPYEATAPWSAGAIYGVFRFLKRVWELQYKIKNKKLKIKDELSREDLTQMHKTIKKVGEDLEMIQFNTAVSSLMSWINYLSAKPEVSKAEYQTFLKLLAPFAPHITEELYQRLRVGISNFSFDPELRTGGQFPISNQSNNSTMKQSSVRQAQDKKIKNQKFESIHLQSWPEYEEKYLVKDQVLVVVQVNGKMRDVVSIPYTVYSIQNEAENEAKKSQKVSKYLEGKKVKKVIYVEGKIINFVV
ncbi:MAG: hypothetical protein COU25_03320 [Candidatus Levybacteria bacterium CG10_big_fil_rev_8_21_14_0_10_35_13]|nr:MAG: hypothetical protein COU25_03320 [Candidatus Levybacteria bacterium CG10_big_fil_rev_8_21_14_0_10_35_13]